MRGYWRSWYTGCLASREHGITHTRVLTPVVASRPRRCPQRCEAQISAVRPRSARGLLEASPWPHGPGRSTKSLFPLAAERVVMVRVAARTWCGEPALKKISGQQRDQATKCHHKNHKEKDFREAPACDPHHFQRCLSDTAMENWGHGDPLHRKGTCYGSPCSLGRLQSISHIPLESRRVEGRLQPLHVETLR